MDNTSVKFEQQCELNVVEQIIYNKFKIKCITEEKIKQYKQINYFVFLFLHFNREIIDGLVVGAYNDSSDSDSDDLIGFTSDDEHYYLNAVRFIV
jgi:hypothetical protein